MEPHWLAEYRGGLAHARENAELAGECLRQVNGGARSPRGEVEVTVGPSGALTDLRLTPAARALAAEELARLILATAQQAHRAAGAKTMAILTNYAGDGPAVEFVRRNLPPVGPCALPDGRLPNDFPDDDEYFAHPPEIIL